MNVVVNEEDAHLLLLLDKNIDVRGGLGGDPGMHGHGGGGGHPGFGGIPHVYWVSGPDGESRSVQVPGGSTASYGPDGQTPSTPLHPGRNGADGFVVFTLVRENRSKEVYDSIFDLQLVAFDVATMEEDDDEVYEPGERLALSNLVVKNVGGMPVPSGHTTLFYFNKFGSHLEPIPGEEAATLKFVGEIPAGEQLEIQGQIGCRIKPIGDRDSPEPLSDEVKIVLDSRLQAIPHTFQNFDSLNTSIIVEYPVRIDKVDMLRSLAAGQQSRIFTSCSHKGKAAVEGRKLQLCLSGSLLKNGTSETDLEEANLLIAQSDSGVLVQHSAEGMNTLEAIAKQQDLSKYWDFGGQGGTAPELDISSLEPQGSMDHAGIVMLGSNAKPLERMRLKVALVLDAYPLSEAKSVVVQAINVDVSVGQEFSAEGGDVVLFINKEIDVETFTFVKATLEKQYYLKVDVYDVSYNGIPDLSSSQTGPLADYISKQQPIPPVVVFNNPFALAAGHGAAKVALLEHLSKQGMQHFMRTYSTNFLVLSADETKVELSQLREFSTPVIQSSGGSQSSSAAGIAKAFTSDGTDATSVEKPVEITAVEKAMAKAAAYTTQLVASVENGEQGGDMADLKARAKLKAGSFWRSTNWHEGRVVSAELKSKDAILRGLADALPIEKRVGILANDSNKEAVEFKAVLESVRNELIMELLLLAKNSGKPVITEAQAAKAAIDGLKSATQNVKDETIVDAIVFTLRQPGLCARLYGMNRPSGLQKYGSLLKKEALTTWNCSKEEMVAALLRRREFYGFAGSSDLKKRNAMWERTIQETRISSNVLSSAQLAFIKGADTRGVSCVRGEEKGTIKQWNDMEVARVEAAVQAGEDKKKDLEDFLIDA